MTKYLKLILMFAGLAMMFFVQSCNEDEGPANPPILTLTSPNLMDGIYTTDESGTVEISVSVNAPNGFNVLRISYDGINVDTQEFVRTEDGQQSLDLNYELTEIVYGSAGSFTITFLAVDDTDQTTEVVVTVQPELPTIVLTEDNPNIVDGTLEAFVDQAFNMHYRYTFPAGFGQFKSTLTFGTNSSETVVTELPPTQGLAVTDAIIFTFDENYLGMDISYTLQITDVLGNTAQIAIPVNLTQPPAKIYTAVLLAAPTDDETSQTFFSTNLGQTFSVSDVNSATGNVSKEIDFGYYYGENDLASLVGPANFPSSIYDLGPNGENWTTLNTANFFRTNLTESEFNEFDENSQSEINTVFEDLLAANGGNPIPVRVIDLQEGEIISFQTDLKNNKRPRGLLKVISITGTIGSDASIEIEVIVNQ